MNAGPVVAGVAAAALALLPVGGGSPRACTSPAAIGAFAGVGYPDGTVVRARPGDPDPDVDPRAGSCRDRARIRAGGAAVLGIGAAAGWAAARRRRTAAEPVGADHS